MIAVLLAPLAFLLGLLGPTPTDPTVSSLSSTVLLGIAAVVLISLLATRAIPTTAAHTPAVAVRARRRALDQGPPPRQHDPDAAGHTRSRAPSAAPAAA